MLPDEAARSSSSPVAYCSPASSAGIVGASGLLAPRERAATDVLNGVTHDPVSGHLLLTGKLWPAVFEVEVVEVG